MKQTDYLSLGALKVSVSCGSFGQPDWLGRTEADWSAYITPTITYRFDPTMTGNPPTRAIALAWLRWYVQISFSWDPRVSRTGIIRNSGHHRTHAA